MNNCCENIPTYRVVNTITERNSIPCIERLNGMLVTVIGSDSSYKEYMLRGGDPCVNSNWTERFGMSQVNLNIGHVTIEDIITEVISDLYLNTRFPQSMEGFRVTFLDLKSTFMKISGDRWVLTNSIL